MINILICDDDSSFAARLKNLSEQYFSVHGIPAAVSAFSDAEEIGSETFASCDIALLDIDYVSKPYNGLDVARRLRAVRKDAVLIFITNYVEYAPEGYEVRAFRYLLKSEIDRKFAPCLTQAVACLRTESPKLKLSCEGENAASWGPSSSTARTLPSLTAPSTTVRATPSLLTGRTTTSSGTAKSSRTATPLSDCLSSHPGAEATKLLK